jgi:hypothetical protein
MHTFSIHKPFAILKGLRDGQLKNIAQLTTSGSPHKIIFFALDLEQEGLITLDRQSGDILPKREVFELLNLLNVSLSQLEQFDHDLSIIANPIFHLDSRGTDSDGMPEVFVLMPFSSELGPVYQDHIRPTIESLGHSCARADDFFTADSIMSDIWRAINASKAVIADCTGRNPNVFYEIGIAHAIGKGVVLIAQSIDDIPFDLRHRRAITYEYTPRGMRGFEGALKRTISEVLDRPTRRRETAYPEWRSALQHRDNT